MRLRIAAGATQEWAERALPLLEEASLRQVGLVTAAEGEYLECELDYEGPGALPADVLFDVLARVRGCIADSMVPHVDIVFIRG